MILVAKLGSSTLVGDDGGLRTAILERRVADLVRARGRGHRPVLVSSGAIACGLGRLGLRREGAGMADLQAASAVGQGLLFQHYVTAFAPHGVVPAQVLLTSNDVSQRASYLNARTTLTRLLDLGVVPVINENDTVSTDELTFGDNDVLAAQVAILLGAGCLLLLTDRDGLYGTTPDGPTLIHDVPADVAPEDLALADMGAGRGRGGVASKVASASMATAAGVTCVIASGRRDGVIPAVAAGEPIGTRFRPGARRESAFKLWLRHAKPAMGRIAVDPGAAAALHRRGTSLLAVGVTGCEGTFLAGDAVEVVDPAGTAIAKGIVRLSAKELSAIAGLRSHQARDQVPSAPDEVIHRDQLVLVGAAGRGRRSTMSAMTTTSSPADVRGIAQAARRAGRELAQLGSGVKDAALREIADSLEANRDAIIAANAIDLELAREDGASDATLDRLTLGAGRIGAMANGVRAIAGLRDPVGVIDDGWRLPNGLQVERRRIPLGVIAVVYEGRPNVTSDSVALALKSANAIVLRGSSTAERSNRAIVEVTAAVLAAAGLPAAAVTLLGTDRDDLRRLIALEGDIDLVIPRGGEGLKKFLGENSRVPVIYAASGNCHIYVHADADPQMALDITVNAKVQRPGVCNAAETLLVHRDIAADFLPIAAAALAAEGVELRVDDAARAAIGAEGASLPSATEEDWATEYLDLILAVRVVDSVAAATDHIGLYGSGHSEAIVTRSLAAATAFERAIDSACVYINASTRFTDGGEFGMGAEIGNSTQKLHARGPIGISELTTYKYVVSGDGQIRG